MIIVLFIVIVLLEKRSKVQRIKEGQYFFLLRFLLLQKVSLDILFQRFSQNDWFHEFFFHFHDMVSSLKEKYVRSVRLAVVHEFSDLFVGLELSDLRIIMTDPFAVGFIGVL